MERIIQQIQKSSTFYIFGHIDPDGDCVGSQLALALFLNQLGKKTFLYSKGKFERREIKKFQNHFEETFVPVDKDGVVIIVDCSTPERTGFEDEHLDDFITIVIDHHSSGEAFGDLGVVAGPAVDPDPVGVEFFDALPVELAVFDIDIKAVYLQDLQKILRVLAR